MKIDIHVHSAERSACARSGEEEVIRASAGAGLDAVFFTDHDRLVPPGRLYELNEKYRPFKIFGGIEVSAGKEHILVLGLDAPELESAGSWTCRELVRFASRMQGFTVLAHPYRYAPPDEEVFLSPPDAVEFRSSNINPENEGLILSAAGRMGCSAVCSSDGHRAENAGMFFVELEERVADEAEAISLMKEGRFACGENPLKKRRHREGKRTEEALERG